METNPCLICYRISPTLVNTELEHGICNVNDKAALTRFLYLFGRHLEDGDGRGMRVEFEKLTNAGVISSCADCSKIMKSFSELYHQMKSIELLLNWKVQTLKNIMQCASRVPSRMDKFRERMALLNTGGILTDEIMDLKECLVTECTKKLNSSFPRLEVRKCDSDKFKKASNSLSVSIRSEIIDPPAHAHMAHGIVEDDFPDCMDTGSECEDNEEPNFKPSPQPSSSPPIPEKEHDDDSPHNAKQIIRVTVIKTLSVSATKSKVDMSKIKIENNLGELNDQEEGFSCQLCSKDFISKSEKIRHDQMTHFTWTPKPVATNHKCEFCSEMLYSMQQASCHKKVCHVLHPEKIRMLYECGICHEKFRSLGLRTVHQAAAHNGEKYSCDYCHETFVVRAYKYVHQQTCPKRPLPNSE